MAGMRLTNEFGDERAVVEYIMTTRPDIANPVTNSPKTLTAYFALCVPVRSANKGFNNLGVLQGEMFCRVRL